MYKSPIEIIQEQMTMQMNMEMENGILKAVQRYNIDVDKEELLKALKYDREQYDKGYQDGLNADKWIPCSERLPDTKTKPYQSVLLQVGNSIVVGYVNSAGQWFVDTGDGWSANLDGEPVAWQPLPEPYKGE